MKKISIKGMTQLCICLLIGFSVSYSQDMSASYEYELKRKIESIQFQIKEKLESYFFNDIKKILNDSLRPAYISHYEGNLRGGYCPTVIFLNFDTENLHPAIRDTIVECIKGCWKPSNNELKRTDVSNIEIDYQYYYSNKHKYSKISELFSILESNEKNKFIYTGELVLRLVSSQDKLQIFPVFILYQWKLSKKQDIFENSDSVKIIMREEALSFIPEREHELQEKIINQNQKVYTEKPSKTKDTIIEDATLALNFYGIIDAFLLNKGLSFFRNDEENFINMIIDSLNNRMKMELNYYEYFGFGRRYLLNQFFSNYLAQPEVVSIFNREFRDCTQKTFDDRYGFKFNYFIKNGTKKIGVYKIMNAYREIDEFNNLPIEIRRLFEQDRINAEQLIRENYHSLCIKNGKLLYFSIVNDASLDDLIEAMKLFHNYGMWFDIIEFFSRYATALIIQDNYTLADAWYNKAMRITRLDRNEQTTKNKKDIVRRIMNIWKYRYTWVNYFLLRDPITNKLDVRFYCWSSENRSGFQEIITYQNLNSKPNFIAKITMNQNWYNFHRIDKEITYASVDNVDFFLNIFNIEAVIHSLSGETRMYPDDYFGLMIYLKHLFQNDDRFVAIKNKYKNLISIQKLLRLNEPEVSEIQSFILDNFSEEYLNSNQKLELLNFFKTDAYESLHLAYNIFHQAYIQIIGSRTKPHKQQEIAPFDNLFPEIIR